ncbi:MAG: hypothetical protein QNI88_05565 [Desulfobacterales bacterium]|nr:hypothetical protein [Desulfobacterales bacterium]
MNHLDAPDLKSHAGGNADAAAHNGHMPPVQDGHLPIVRAAKV